MTKPAVFIADFFTILHDPKTGYLTVWEAVLAGPQCPVVVCSTGVRSFIENDARKVARELIEHGHADGMEIRRIDDEDVLSEADVKQMLRAMTEVRGQLSALARRAGIKPPAITNVLRGDDKPGGKLLEAMGLLRIPQVDHYNYIRRPDDVEPWRSDYRGGVGGTALFYT